MANVRSTTQFSVFLVNKPGILAQVTRALANAKVNIVALTLVDSQEHGVLRIVDENPAETRDVLAKLNLPMTETDVLCMELSNRPGALADVAQLLGENHININYAYCTSGAPGGQNDGCAEGSRSQESRAGVKDDQDRSQRTEPRTPRAAVNQIGWLDGGLRILD